MSTLSTQDLARACEIFLRIAYPGGPAAIPAEKLPYHEMVCDAPIEDYLPPASNAIGICQDLSKTKARVPGFEFRLGSAAFPHLKLRVQIMEFRNREVWVYSVDTHDQFHSLCQHTSADEADAWRKIIEQNRMLKRQIEESFAAAGFFTPTNILKLDLTASDESQI